MPAPDFSVKISRILHPTDFSEQSRHALEYALAFAREFSAKLYILHVVQNLPQALYLDMLQMPSATDLIERIEDQARKELEKLSADQADARVERLMRRGAPSHEIILCAREIEADLIVLGTHGRTGLKHALFGSVAEKVVRASPCPVLSVRHPRQGFEMP